MGEHPSGVTFQDCHGIDASEGLDLNPAALPPETIGELPGPDGGAFFFHCGNSSFHRGANRCNREAIEIHHFQIKPERGITNFHRDALFSHCLTIVPDRSGLILKREGLFSQKLNTAPPPIPGISTPPAAPSA